MAHPPARLHRKMQQQDKRQIVRYIGRLTAQLSTLPLSKENLVKQRQLKIEINTMLFTLGQPPQFRL